MLLSRVADNLYWGARYLERADDTARVVRSFKNSALIKFLIAGLPWQRSTRGTSLRG